MAEPMEQGAEPQPEPKPEPEPKISEEEKTKAIHLLTRFLYTNNYNGVFYAAHPEHSFPSLQHNLTELLAQAAPLEFMGLLEKVEADKDLVRRKNIFYIVAVVLESQMSSQTREKIRQRLVPLIRSDDDLFDFIQYHTQQRAKKQRTKKITTLVRKVVSSYYNSKSGVDLAKCLTGNGLHSWRHKDVIKMVHYKAPTVESSFLVQYTLRGASELETEPNISPEVMEYLRQSHKLKTTSDKNETISLLQILKANLKQVNSMFVKDKDVILAALPSMSLGEVLRSLPRFLQLGLLADNTPARDKILTILRDKSLVRKSDLHPGEVFVHLKNFQKGGKPTDPKLIDYMRRKYSDEERVRMKTRRTVSRKDLQGACSKLIGQLLMETYNHTLKYTRKTFLMTIDVMGDLDQGCFLNKNVTIKEAIFCLYRCFIKLHVAVTIAVFKNKEIHILRKGASREKEISFKQFAAMFDDLDVTPTYMLANAPLKWAIKENRKIDVFMNFTFCNWFSKLPPNVDRTRNPQTMADKLQEYKRIQPNARVIKFCLGGNTVGVLEQQAADILTVAGFSENVPRVVDAFARGKF